MKTFTTSELKVIKRALQFAVAFTGDPTEEIQFRLFLSAVEVAIDKGDVERDIEAELKGKEID